jgi:hypothetical protein
MTISITRDQAKRFLFSGWHGLTNAHIPERKICRFVHEKETECSLPNKSFLSAATGGFCESSILR